MSNYYYLTSAVGKNKFVALRQKEQNPSSYEVGKLRNEKIEPTQICRKYVKFIVKM